ncbi:MAG: RNA polymerase sigma factor [Saprospiraceae bacterium]
MPVSKTDCKKFSDKEIIEKSKGNFDYFRCLYERYDYRLKAFIRKISDFDHETIDDILQNSFIKIWKNINNYDDSMEVSSFIFAIVRNETVSYWRKEKTQKKIKNNLNSDDDQEVNDSTDDIDNEMDSGIKKILEKLPEKYREILILKFFENMDYEEISDILKIPEGTVATRINRAKTHFAKIAEKDNIYLNKFK